ncbi:MAG: DNA polymerase III subunit beta [Deltaproteobacteria bacterium]|nr:DNA polymerase III subunit beta [Deltaproteobacteria bacterium]
MEINIKKDILIEALQLIINISHKSTTEPIINHVFFETFDNRLLTIKATNYDNSFSGDFEAEIINPGKICLNTSKLYNLVREFSDSKIQIKTTPQNWVFIINGNTKIMLPGIEPDQFPLIDFLELDNPLNIPSSLIKDSIDRTFFSIGENESRRNLMGLNLHFIKPNQICWQGADAFRISHDITEVKGENYQGNIIIPKKSLIEIKKILEYHNNDLQISFNENIFQINAGNIRFKTRLIEAAFPNLENIINSEGPIGIKINRKELINSLKILYRISDDDLNSVVKLTISNGKVLLESQKLEFGEGNDVILCDYEGEEISIGVNIKFFLDGLQVFDNSSDKQINIKIKDSLSPIILKNEEWGNYKTILMPVKIKW